MGTMPEKPLFRLVRMDRTSPSRRELLRWASVQDANVGVPLIRAVGTCLLILQEIAVSLRTIAEHYERRPS